MVANFGFFFLVQTTFLESAAKTIKARDYIFGTVLDLVF